ncbi:MULTISPECIES: methionyl-tRNA formyltransferase [Arenibacter]|uniref:methionyl-tRNA formyltransferase n=1 Tax=Arenibacter TaxID=178469 RepID=UPI001C069BD1|nr:MULTISPECIES: methionyl-tRNA formyltransferase [Arenibacter]MBU2907588.1 methionyl-tRNA formyltransferase [Arenibacter algicola]MCK0133410.1 methionyl-tRNA formyltransferase [Arenibacter sp. S6351L]
MSKPRIVFMGTPDFAVAILDKLVKNDCNIVGVITAPDKPAGRGRKLHESAVKAYAMEHGLKIMQPTNLKDPNFITELQGLSPELQIVVAFRMLPKAVWNMPKLGTFNLHASLLPQYRGAAPINWAIINGEKETGVTTFFIDDKIDTGAILLQKKTSISEEDTAGSLHDKLMHLGADLVLETIHKLESKAIAPSKQQEDKPLKEAYKLHKETCEIDWNQDIATIYNFIRGLSPYPTAWTTMYNGEDELFLKIYSAKKDLEQHQLKVGTIAFTKNELKVAVKGGYINLLEIQLPGKRKMTTKEVLNGLKLAKNTYVG